MKEVYIWGAGHFGVLAALDMEQNGKTIAGFIDSDKKLQGKRRLGYEVFAPEQILPKKKNKVIIAALAVDEIAEELETNGYVEDVDFEMFEHIQRKPKFLYKADNNNTININDLELVENIDILFENEVILYDAEFCGKETGLLLKKAGIHVSYFANSYSGRWGEYIDGIEIISPDKLKQFDNEKSLAIIIASNDIFIMKQIIADISALELKTNKIYTKVGLNISLSQNINDCRISEKYRSIKNSMSAITPFVGDNSQRKAAEIATTNIINGIDNILVYQPGKVGSSTVHRSMNALNIGNSHIHKLTYDEVSNIYKKLDVGAIKIITLVREPVSRIISQFFQLIGNREYCFAGQFTNEIIECLKLKSTRILQGAVCQFEWFDHELKAVFGIDIYDHPFNKEKGYSIIKQGNYELLAMKMEKINSLESVIGEFIGAPQFKLINDNIGDNAAYKYLYKNVRDTIKIPREIFDTYYKNNHKMNHFYSEDEKIGFLNKWKNNIAD